MVGSVGLASMPLAMILSSLLVAPQYTAALGKENASLPALGHASNSWLVPSGVELSATRTVKDLMSYSCPHDTLMTSFLLNRTM